MSDIVLNIHEAKSHLSHYLNNLGADDRIILCKRNRPFAEVRLLPDRRRKKRRLGVAKGQFTVPESFFDPLPPDILDAFEGKS
jgi:antitoxin (DNA-binding transcriptional repressor) of toxin-antitoxin stability system